MTDARGVVLIGLRRAGKTVVGRALAESLGRPFIDTDALIAEKTGRDAAAWITGLGLESFREVERAAVASASDRAGAVIAAGGGAPLLARNRARLRAHGVVIYLRADPFELLRRASLDAAPAARPLLGEGTAADEPFRLFVERDALYRDACDAIVDATPPVAAVLAACRAALARLSFTFDDGAC